MNKWHKILSLSIVSIGVTPLLTDDLTAAPKNTVKSVLNEKIKNSPIKTSHKKMIWFRYKDEPLINVVNDLAEKMGINVLLPQGPNALTTKLTFELPHKITINRGWQYLITILNISGFTLIPHAEFSTIIKNDKNNVSKEALPLYINVSPEKLPNTDLKIRYLRYLTNLQVPTVGTSASPSGTDLQKILTDVLSATGTVLWEPQLNGLVIIDSARIIKSVMTVVEELDAATPVEAPAFIKLKHTSAAMVKNIFDQLISGVVAGANPSFSPPLKSAVQGSGYFTKGTKIIAENRTNALIVLGKKEAVKRIVECIENYIDVPLDSGKSILHIYDLQYLKASDFATTLSAITSNQSSGGPSSGLGGAYGSSTGQSTSSGENTGEQYFKGVTIVPESQSVSEGEKDSVQKKTQSGNRLIIACTTQDWIRIKKLIRELDKPQMQVMIHGLIVDLSFTGLKELNSQLRNQKDLFLKNTSWQTAHLSTIENETGSAETPPTSNTALMANLLPTNANTSTGENNMAAAATTGSFILSFADPKTNGIWWLTKILNKDEDSKVLSQPFLIAMNNQKVTTTDKETRLLEGIADERYGSVKENLEHKEANITLECLPHINKNKTINITIKIDINEWISDTSKDQNSRNITTNVNLKSGDILILGGLSKTKVESAVTKTPLFGDIPLLGNLFRGKTQTITKSNLMVFLRPQIVSIDDNTATDRMMKRAHNILSETDENFSLLKDPITRWFFGKTPRGVSPKVLEDFREETENINKSLKKMKRNTSFVAMPEPRIQKQQEKAHEILKKEKPSDRQPLNAEELEKEEAKAAEELKRLFGWQENNDRNQQSTETVISGRIAPEHKLKPSPEETNTFSQSYEKEEETNAAEELKEILDNNPDLAKAFEK